MDNGFVRGRLEAKDPKGMQTFYGDVFPNWSFRSGTINGIDYVLINTGNGPGGEMVKGDRKEWIPFVGVRDVTSTLDKVKKNGGIVVENRTKFGDFGFYGLFQDPEGAVMGLWEES